MKQINPNLPPPNGYKFLNHDGTWIKGNSWRELERALLEYRRRTGGKVDDLWQEILTQICAAAQGFCKDAQDPNKTAAAMSGNNKARMLNWLSSMARVNHATVSREQATDRARVCLSCAQRKEVQMGCQGCNRAIGELRKKIMNGGTPVSAALGLCDMLGSDLAAATHVAEPPSVDPRLPAHCWRRG